MNRAVMLRFAACGAIGLGAALLIAALLLSTYTTSRIAEIPLDIDATEAAHEKRESVSRINAKTQHEYGSRSG
ncbi:porin PorA family protein [Mycobacterium tuberculosis]